VLPGPQEVLDNPDVDEREEGRRALLDTLPDSDPETSISILETLVSTGFGLSAEPAGTESLMPDERETLKALARGPHAWPPTEGLAGALRNHGVPGSREGIRELLKPAP
jgi:hypothetical protein